MAKNSAEILREEGLEEELNQTRIIDIFQDSAPVSWSAVVPKNWILKEEGVYLRRYSKNGEEVEPKLITYEPIVISGIYENLTDNSEGFIVSWFNGRVWKQIARSRDFFMATNKIIDLSISGFPVNSNNSKNLIQYLTDFHAINRLKLDLETYSEQMGWIQGGFLLGNDFISDSEDSITFYPADTGEKQLAEGFHTEGNINKWLNIINRVSAFPKVMAGVYASFSSVLLDLVGVDSFIFEWSGETSKGKTISMKISASVWGKPTEKQGGIIKTWNSTPVSIERAASVLKNLPLFLDDTKNLQKSKSIAHLIYNLAFGQGKGRGSIKGSQTLRYWNTVTFSTGEQKITSFTKDGGTVGRVIPISGKPFGNDDRDTAITVEGLEMDVQDCYGVAGDKWIKYLLENLEDRDTWKSYYRSIRHVYSEKANGNSVVGRIAKYMAVLDLAGFLFNECFETNYDYQSILLEVWEKIIRENGEVDRPKQALESVISWFNVNKNRFITERGVDQSGRQKDVLPVNEVWGKCLKEDNLFIFPTVLESFLEKQGYEPTSILTSWKERDWIVLEANRLKGRMHVDGTQERGYIIKNEIIQSMDL